MPFRPRSPRPRLISLAISLFTAGTIWSLWYGMNSDKDDIPPVLTQLIPAGHCACHTSTAFECSSCLDSAHEASKPSPAASWTFQYGRDDKNEGLTEQQCNAAFPGLFEDVRLGAGFWTRKGKISMQTLDCIALQPSMTRAMIFDGQLYVIATKSKAEDHRRKMLATLGSIHRALVADTERQTLPNIEFVFSIEDKADDVGGDGHPLWVLTRKATEESLWLMPDFGFWAWDNIVYDKSNEIGPYDEVVEKAVQLEEGLPFAQKMPKLVWRGKLSFAPKMRHALLDQSRGQEWNDVKELNWKVRENYMSLEDHCRYQYIAHVEGRSYSASLKYRQACNSVLLIHKLQYIQHHHYLLASSGPHQNYVEVERDFSDLPAKMDSLIQDPAEAQRIAKNSVETFRERYLTQAAEACYWRALWRGYASVSESVETKRGTRFETFLLMASVNMLDFSAG